MPADAEKAFSFDDYPLTEKRVEELLESLRKQLHTAIVNSVRSSWTLANNKNNELCNVVFGSNVGKLTQEQYRRYYSTNDKALDAFIQRKENGMNLSDRVWHYSDLFKNEIEMGLDLCFRKEIEDSLELGIREGKDAASMARDLKQYLQHPDKLFRRVRDEHGNLHLSKAAADFHPGRGVYRSSYMNARRLAATETNIAYRTADHERMKNLDFVVGIEIHLSHNHTCKGRDGKPHPFTDICNELEGKYPKDFKFTGWHPHCRCYVTSILKSDKEIAEDTKKILRGEEVTGESKNMVEDVPEGYKKWVEKNEERIKEAKKKGTLPYFVRDNERLTEANNAGNDENRSHNSHRGQLGHKPTKHGERYISVPMKPLDPDAEAIKHTTKQANTIHAKMVKPMSYDKADQGHPNSEGDIDNCQSAAVAFYARLLGMKATAKKYADGGDFVKRLENDQALAYWKSPRKKEHPESSRKLMSIKEATDYLEKETAKNGIYNISLNKYKDSDFGHVICLIKVDGKAYFVDVQKGIKTDFLEQLSHVDFVPNEKKERQKGVEFLRIDKCVLSDDALKVLNPN